MVNIVLRTFLCVCECVCVMGCDFMVKFLKIIFTDEERELSEYSLSTVWNHHDNFARCNL